MPAARALTMGRMTLQRIQSQLGAPLPQAYTRLLGQFAHHGDFRPAAWVRDWWVWGPQALDASVAMVGAAPQPNWALLQAHRELARGVNAATMATLQAQGPQARPVAIEGQTLSLGSFTPTHVARWLAVAEADGDLLYLDAWRGFQIGVFWHDDESIHEFAIGLDQVLHSLVLTSAD